MDSEMEDSEEVDNLESSSVVKERRKSKGTMMSKIQKLELQHKMEMQKKRMEMEEELRMKELELKARQRKIEESIRLDEIYSMRKSIVPEFDEKNIEAYFDHFERSVVMWKVPKDEWARLMMPDLTGRARDAFLRMPLEDCQSYEKLKSAILEEYQSIPEVYRQRFRQIRKEGNKSYRDFAHELKIGLERWLRAEKVNEDNAMIKELILMEAFCDGISIKMREHVAFQRVKTVREAALMLDEIAAIREEEDSDSVEARDVQLKVARPKMNKRIGPFRKSLFQRKIKEVEPYLSHGETINEIVEKSTKGNRHMSPCTDAKINLLRDDVLHTCERMPRCEQRVKPKVFRVTHNSIHAGVKSKWRGEI